MKDSEWTDKLSIRSLVDTLKRLGDADLAVQVAQKAIQAFSNAEPGVGALSDDGEMVSHLSFAIGDAMESKGEYESAAEWFLAAAQRTPSERNYWLKASTALFPAEKINLERAETVLSQGNAALGGEEVRLAHALAPGYSHLGAEL